MEFYSCWNMLSYQPSVFLEESVLPPSFSVPVCIHFTTSFKTKEKKACLNELQKKLNACKENTLSPLCQLKQLVIIKLSMMVCQRNADASHLDNAVFGKIRGKLETRNKRVMIQCTCKICILDRK